MYLFYNPSLQALCLVDFSLIYNTLKGFVTANPMPLMRQQVCLSIIGRPIRDDRPKGSSQHILQVVRTIEMS
jgi:hypothetical protein